MAFLAGLSLASKIALGASAASTALAAGSAVKAGKESKYAGELAAQQQERSAKAREAESQREAIYRKKQATLLSSRARAAAAASGAGTDNINIENLLGDIEAEGEYQKLATLYSGKSDANAANFAAAISRREGRARKSAYNLSAASTIMSGAGDWYGKYKDLS